MFTSIVFSSYVSLFCCRIAVFLFWFCSNIVSYSQWILLKKSAFFRTFLFWSTGTAHKVCIILCIIYKIRLVSTKNESSCEREWEIEWERVAFVHFYRFPCSIPWFKGFLCSTLDIFGWNHALKYPRKLNGLTWTYPAMGLSVGMLARLTCMCSCLGKFEMKWTFELHVVLHVVEMARIKLSSNLPSQCLGVIGEQAWHWGHFLGVLLRCSSHAALTNSKMFITICRSIYHVLCYLSFVIRIWNIEPHFHIASEMSVQMRFACLLFCVLADFFSVSLQSHKFPHQFDLHEPRHF